MARFCIVIPDDEIDGETKDAFRAVFAAHEECVWCGGIHQGMCPRVRKIVYHPTDDRQIREVEFWGDGEWSRATVVMPEDVVLCLISPRTRFPLIPLTSRCGLLTAGTCI